MLKCGIICYHKNQECLWQESQI